MLPEQSYGSLSIRVLTWRSSAPELAQRLNQVAWTAALLGLSAKDLEKRMRTAYDRVTSCDKELR